MSWRLLCVNKTQTQAMQRRTFPARPADSILLYGFGLALVLSLVFNGFLLVEQTHRVSLYDDEAGRTISPMELFVRQQLLDCQQANQPKDSRIGVSTDSLRRADFHYPTR